MTPEQFNFLAQYVSRSSELLAYMAAQGARYSRDVVIAYQQRYNADLSLIQSAYAALAAEQNRPASEVTQELREDLGELVVDGLWGEQTARRAGLFATRTSNPPRFATNVGAWWTRHSGEYTSSRDLYLARARQEEIGEAPPAPDAPKEDAVSPDAGSAALPPASVKKPEDDGVSKWNWASILGVVAILGVGGFLAYRIMKSKGRSTKRLAASAS